MKNTSNKKTKTSSTSGKKVPVKKSSVKTPTVSSTSRINYRPIKIGKTTYATTSQAIRYLLQSTSFNQSEIASMCHVTPPCVNQLARALKK